MHDRETGETTRVSVDSDGNEGNDGSTSDHSISANGRYVSFWSKATNLVPGDTNGFEDVFVHDRETGETRRVSLDSDGNQGQGDSYWADMSDDGRWIVFQSEDSNLVPGDTSGSDEIFLAVNPLYVAPAIPLPAMSVWGLIAAVLLVSVWIAYLARRGSLGYR